MSLILQELPEEKLLEVDLTGKLSKQDYDHFTPQVEDAIRKHGKVRLLVQIQRFDGWTMGAFWEEIKFDMKHFRDLDRIAFVGDKKWEASMSKFCRPFSTAEIQFFPPEKKEQARSWLEG